VTISDPPPPPANLEGEARLRVETLLAEGLDALGLEVGLAPVLAELSLLLARWAARMSLTGHRDAEAIARRLVLDALALSTRLPEVSSLVDLGSGAGFPGLPLALVRPACQVTLVESRERRHHFQRAAVRALRLGNVEARRGRAEALPPTPHDLAIAQAMAEPARAARWLIPWVRPGGWLAIPGGESGPQVPELVGLDPAIVVSYAVPLGGPARTLWLARRAP
jgi:16S rRNA (guanine527-N7)-methyltransferase